MTWEEAQKAMQSGKTVTHRHFTTREHFKMEAGHIVCEDGYSMAGWYKGEDWQKTGWSIKEV